MTRTHGRSHAARRDPTEGGDPFPEVPFDADEPCDAAREVWELGSPWILEVGSGNGVYLAAEAAANPEGRYLGVEREAEFFYKMKKRLIRERLPNARCIRGEIEDVLDTVAGPGSVSEVVVNFSDPWPKRRHRERRVFTPAFLERLERVLTPEGKVHFKTDVGWYFNLAIGELRRRRGWSVVEAGPVAEGGAGVETNFERKGREQGRAIWSFTGRREGAERIDPKVSAAQDGAADAAGGAHEAS